MICQIDKKNIKRAHNFKDLTGQRFGKLIAVDYEIRTWNMSNSGKRSCVYWKCICDCGSEHFVYKSHLSSGAVISCGCSKYLDFGLASFNKLIYA